jgi:hypothetical protein
VISIIIPCAVRVGGDLEYEFGPIPPGLVPIAGQTALDLIVRTYGQLGEIRVYVAIHEGQEMVERHYDFFPDERVSLVEVGPTRSIGHTLQRVFELHPEVLDGYCIVNFADTILEDFAEFPQTNDFIVTAVAGESIRWTLFQEEDGRIVRLSDKEFQLDPENWLMFVGVWGLFEPRRFASLLASHLEKGAGSAFYGTVLEYFNSSPTTRFLESESFIDVGHADNYYVARRRMINRRFFNSLEFNETSGSIRKTSQNREKLIDEITWLQKLPQELAFFTPRIFSYSKDPLAPYVEMEFYSYPSLDDSFVSGRYDLDIWEKLFQKLFGLVNLAGKYTVRDEHLRRDLQEMYVGKTVDRLQAMLEEGQISPEITDRPLTIDGHRCPALRDVLANLPALLERNRVLEVDQFSVIHGDLCLGNILYDAKHGLLKLIDARGKFGRFDIYGDVHYDLAKLSHSVLGLYDFTMADQFRVEKIGDDTYAVRTLATSYHEDIARIFTKHLTRNGFDLRRVRTLESLLFLSMVPLHRDRPARQLAMVLRGLSIIGAMNL